MPVKRKLKSAVADASWMVSPPNKARKETMRKADALSAQEQRVVALVVEGRSNKQIAAALGLSDKTVKNYLSNVFQKLGISRRAQAAALFGTGSLPPE